jgi:orotidine-5'-phosphate decarboxylase
VIPYEGSTEAETPRQAVQDGASMIVVGRPIRDAPEPYEATKGILAELEADQC